MAPIAVKRYLYFAIASCLILAVTGTSAFSTAGVFQVREAAVNPTPVHKIFTFKTHTTDWLAEEQVSLSKAGESSSSPFRSGALRLYMPSEYNYTSYYLGEASFLAGINDHLIHIKNSGFIKLLL
jgi:hypothetical protein